MAVHEMLGKKMLIEGVSLRLGHIRRECDLGIASDSGLNAIGWPKMDGSRGPGFPAYLVKLSTGEVVRSLRPTEQDFDQVILEEKLP